MPNRPIVLLTAAVAVVGANSMVLAPITGAVARDLGGDPAGIVQAAAAFGVTTALSALLLAPRADTIGPDRALRQAVGILCVSLLMSMLSPSKLALVLAQGIGGIGAGMGLPAIYALAPQLGPPGQEKRTMGIVLSGWTLALVAGVAGSGFVAEFFGWRTVYLILFILMSGLWLLILRADLTTERLALGRTSPLTGLRVPGIWRGLLSAGTMMLGFYGTYAFLGAHVVTGLGLGTDEAGFITLCYGIGFGLSVLLDRYFEKLPHRAAGGLSFGGLVLTYGAMLLSGAGYAALLVLALIWGVVQHAALTFVVSRLSALDARQRGAVMGLNSTVTYMAVTGGALVFRLPYEAGGLAACAALSALCAAAGLAEALMPQRGISTRPAGG